MDLDVDNYTTEELTALIGITGELSENGIKEAVQQQKVEHPSKKSAAFFDAIQKKLISAIDEIPVQKIIEVEVKKGTINPDLKTTITRLINIDSSYRSREIATNTVDKFVFELSEPLLNVVSLSFYSLELPQSWYTISNAKGTDSFILYLFNGTGSTIDEATLLLRIPEGNYTTEGLCQAVITTIQNGINAYNNSVPPPAFGFPITILDFASSFNQNTGKFTFRFTSTDGSLTLGPQFTIQLLWYDEKQRYSEMSNNRYDYHLGWLMGTRFPLTTVRFIRNDTVSIPNVRIYSTTVSSLVDVTGTKYIIVAIDDYKTNRLNRAIVSISNTPNTQIALPKYFSQDVPMYKVSPTKTNAIQSNPRNLTMKQIYTINAIMDKPTTDNLVTPYDSSDSFAKIPVKRTDWGKTDASGNTVIVDIPNKLFIENGGPMAMQSREYFGPVDISTMSISLHDDKGNLLGMNGMDWSISIMAKCIYQY